jgi:hypothetical protein
LIGSNIKKKNIEKEEQNIHKCPSIVRFTWFKGHFKFTGEALTLVRRKVPEDSYSKKQKQKQNMVS